MFQSDRDGDRGLFWQPVDGGEAARLTKPDAGEAHEPESSYGDTLLFSVTKGSDVSLWMLSLKDKKSTPFADVHSSTRTGAVFSPDGRWVAYATTEGSTTTIYVQPFPADQASATSSRREAANPNIRCGRRTQNNSSTTRDPASSSPSASRRNRPSPSGTRCAAASISRSFPDVRRPYDITPDGRFVSPIAAGQSVSGRPTAPQIQVVLNWFEELKTRVPAIK